MHLIEMASLVRLLVSHTVLYPKDNNEHNDDGEDEEPSWFITRLRCQIYLREPQSRKER